MKTIKPPYWVHASHLHPLSRTACPHYLINEGTGGGLFDLSCSDNKGIIFGADWVSGEDGAALDLVSANSDYITLPEAIASLGGSDLATIEIVCNPDSLIGGRVYWSAVDVTSFYLFVNAAGKIYVKRTVTDSESGASIVAGTWQSIIIVFTSTTVAKLYVDGAFVENLTVGANPISTGDMYLGLYSGGAPYYFDGRISLFRMWDFALSGVDIARLNSGRYGIY